MKASSRSIPTPGHHPVMQGHLYALDGMRTMAVTLVMITHSGAPWLTGGFVGVDMFFVISGFLITSILINEFDTTGRIHLGMFYLRRALRLGPALAVLLAAIGTFAFIVYNPEDVRKTLIDIALTLGYVANWARALNLHTQYLLGHTWSLSIEEQFYLIWPAILILLLSRLPNRKHILLVIAAGAAVSWMVRMAMTLTAFEPQRIYSGSDTRADGLLIGCFIAVASSCGLFSRESRIGRLLLKVLPIAAPSGTAIILAIALTARWESTMTHLIWWPIVYICTAIIILDITLGTRSIISRILAWKPIAWIGSISYGIYLWHHPVFIGFRLLHFPWWGVLLCGMITTMLIAAVSYYAIEIKALRLKNRILQASLVKQ